MIPEEPMYLVLSVAVSPSFSQRLDPRVFPSTLRIGHVRVYQRSDTARRIGCSPPDHPTAEWIRTHWWAYGLQAPPEVESLVQLDLVGDLAVAVFGVLTMLSGGYHFFRKPLAMLSGCLCSAALAQRVLAPRFYGGGEGNAVSSAHAAADGGHGGGYEGHAGRSSVFDDMASLGATALEAVRAAAAALWGGGGAGAGWGGSPSAEVPASSPTWAHTLESAWHAMRRATPFWLAFNVLEVSLVGGLLLFIFADFTLVLACALAFSESHTIHAFPMCHSPHAFPHVPHPVVFPFATLRMFFSTCHTAHVFSPICHTRFFRSGATCTQLLAAVGVSAEWVARLSYATFACSVCAAGILCRRFRSPFLHCACALTGAQLAVWGVQAMLEQRPQLRAHGAALVGADGVGPPSDPQESAVEVSGALTLIAAPNRSPKSSPNRSPNSSPNRSRNRSRNRHPHHPHHHPHRHPHHHSRQHHARHRYRHAHPHSHHRPHHTRFTYPNHSSGGPPPHGSPPDRPLIFDSTPT